MALSSVGAALFLAVTLLPAGDMTGEQKKAKLDDHPGLSSSWIYDDIPAGIARARAENKPLLIVFR